MRPGGPAASRRWRATGSGSPGGPGRGRVASCGRSGGAGRSVDARRSGPRSRPRTWRRTDGRRSGTAGAASRRRAATGARPPYNDALGWPTRCAMRRRRTAGMGRPRRRAGRRRDRPNGIRGRQRPAKGSSARRHASAKDSRGARSNPRSMSGLLPPGNAKSRRRPIFPKGCPLSIFGAGELNFRVRDGNGCGLSAGVTGIYACDWDVFGSGLTATVPEGRTRGAGR